MELFIPIAALGKIIVLSALAPGDYQDGTCALAELASLESPPAPPSPYLTSVAGGLTVAVILGILG